MTLTLSWSDERHAGNSIAVYRDGEGSTNTAVNWSVNGVAGGNAADGTISARGDSIVLLQRRPRPRR